MCSHIYIELSKTPSRLSWLPIFHTQKASSILCAHNNIIIFIIFEIFCSPRSDWSRHRPHCWPVMIRETEGRGRGLVAARDIKTGEVILQDRPVITVSGEADTWEAGQQIREQVGRMREEDRREFYKLTRMQKLLDISESFLSAAGDDQDHRAKAELVSLYKEETAIFFNNDISSFISSRCDDNRTLI